MSDCGTIRGYFRHRRAGEETCAQCRRAMVDYVSKYRAARDECICGAEKHPSATMCRACARVAATARSAEASKRRAQERKQLRKQLVQVGPLPICWLPESHPAMRRPEPKRRSAFVAGKCAWCEASFVVYGQAASRYCSRRCARSAGKSRRGYFKIPMAKRVAIYVRDGWTCQLCMEPVDPDLLMDPTDEWAPTLDHIEPKSRGGSDRPENLRLAHRWCNSVRSDDSHYTEADLRVA